MKKFVTLAAALFMLAASTSAQEREMKLKIVQTTDVHGNYFPYDFIRRSDARGSLARVHAFVEKERETYKDNLILLDNGDFLQGQPASYYYNYIDTVATHLGSAILDFMGYDAGNLGNHDVETGRPVFERWASGCSFPILGANVIDSATGLPYFKPYAVFRRGQAKIVVLGMITPAIPTWLPESLWQGLRFDDMEETARKWVPVIRDTENPDVLIGLFHSGKNAVLTGGQYRDNASVEVVRRVPGFDVALIGHDHARACFKVAGEAGDTVWIVNPANNAVAVGDVDIELHLDSNGKVVGKNISARITDVADTEVSKEFMERFSAQYDAVQEFVSQKIGHLEESISTRPSYFGPSAFVDLIHSLQLEISGAEISLAAPLSFDAQISAGDIYVGDMFNLYKYENLLYVMSLSGKEVHDALEMSYAMWTNRMESPEDHLLLLRRQDDSGGRTYFQYPSYNFDSAAGIIYTVDVTKPAGQKVTITGMADGTPFRMDKMYRVAVNSYRGNGGGELLTKGAGIPQDRLKERVISSTEKDLRYYLMQYIMQHKDVLPQPLHQWKFIPEEWVENAARRDYHNLFGDD